MPFISTLTRGAFWVRGKWAAEAIAREWAKRTSIPLVIFRPSIIVGRRSDGMTKSFQGYYAITKVGPLPRAGRVQWNGTRITIPFPFFCMPDGLLNVIPIDDAIAVMLALAEATRDHGGVFHVVHPYPITVGWLVAETVRILGIDGFTPTTPANRWRQTGNAFVDNLFNRVTAAYASYAPYLAGGPTFSVANVVARIPSYNPQAITTDFIAKTVAYAERVHFGRIVRSS